MWWVNNPESLVHSTVWQYLEKVGSCLNLRTCTADE